MPYFKWVGIDISGTVKKGTLVAYSSQDLSTRLFQRGIALLNCRTSWTNSFLWKISAASKEQLFISIARLLKAGILVPDVFIIAAQQCDNPFVYDALFLCATDIKNGVSFTQALKKQSYLYDSLARTMLIIGNESGNLVDAVENVALYYRMKNVFAKGIRSALAMPALTFAFFIGISLFIFIVIMPRFADMFVSMSGTLPPITQHMLAISSFMSSWSMLYGVIFFMACFAGIYHHCKNSGVRMWYTCVMKMPFIGNLAQSHELGQVLYALALLEKSNIPLLQAFHIVHPLIRNHVIQKHIHALSVDIESGTLLSQAMSTSLIFSSDVIALIAIGEETGTLRDSLLSAADLYRDSAQSSLHRLVFFIQPLVIIILGFLIGMLILAVYLPIMSLSYSL